MNICHFSVPLIFLFSIFSSSFYFTSFLPFPPTSLLSSFASLSSLMSQQLRVNIAMPQIQLFVHCCGTVCRYEKLQAFCGKWMRCQFESSGKPAPCAVGPVSLLATTRRSCIALIYAWFKVLTMPIFLENPSIYTDFFQGFSWKPQRCKHPTADGK